MRISQRGSLEVESCVFGKSESPEVSQQAGRYVFRTQIVIKLSKHSRAPLRPSLVPGTQKAQALSLGSLSSVGRMQVLHRKVSVTRDAASSPLRNCETWGKGSLSVSLRVAVCRALSCSLFSRCDCPVLRPVEPRGGGSTQT